MRKIAHKGLRKVFISLMSSSNVFVTLFYVKHFRMIFHMKSFFNYFLSFQVIFNSVAYDAGVKNRDFVVEVNGTKVFEMSQDEFKELIKKAGDQIHLKVER